MILESVLKFTYTDQLLYLLTILKFDFFLNNRR